MKTGIYWAKFKNRPEGMEYEIVAIVNDERSGLLFQIIGNECTFHYTNQFEIISEELTKFMRV